MEERERVACKGSNQRKLVSEACHVVVRRLSSSLETLPLLFVAQDVLPLRRWLEVLEALSGWRRALYSL